MLASNSNKRSATQAELAPKLEKKKPRGDKLSVDERSVASSSEHASPGMPGGGILHRLDLSIGSPVTSDSAQERFEGIAHFLIHQHRIVWNDADNLNWEEYEILELEFYLNSEQHADPFTHNAEEQRTLGQWYFHRAPRRKIVMDTNARTKPAGYRGGSRKGLDITLGSPSGMHMHGGILLRTIRRASDKQVISGPSLVVDEFLRVSSASSLTDLVDNKWMHDISIQPNPRGAECMLSLVEVPKPTNPSIIFNSPRIGLDLSHPSAQIDKANPRLRFVCADYRFFTHPELLVANGRGQTFLGVLLWALRYNAWRSSMLATNMAARLSMQPATTTRYLAAYLSAREKGEIRKCIGTTGKGAGSSPVPFLTMAGAVRRYLGIEEPEAEDNEADGAS